MKKIKILVVIPSLKVGSGVASHVMNYYRELRDDFKIEFATFDNRISANIKEINNNNDKIFYFKKKFFRSLKSIRVFFREHENEYDIVHCHTFNYGLPYLFFAKRYGVRNRIIHIHSFKYSDSLIKAFLDNFLFLLCLRVANVYVSCSQKSGEKRFHKKPFTVINNGINLSKYVDKNRMKKRSELRIDDNTFLFGDVGRLTKGKNQLFAIKVFGEIKKKKKFNNSKMILIGSGPENDNLLTYIRQHDLVRDVFFVSSTNNVADYYAAMDCFIFTSLHEGLGMALVEAQASGLPCFCFDGLPKEALVTDLVHVMNLTSDPKNWSEVVSNSDLKRQNVKRQLIEAGFDIREEGKKLARFYHDLVSESKQR